MTSFNQEISKYVDSKSGSWTESTIHTAYHKLCSISSFGFEPESLYSRLKESGKSLYTIKSYFILASKFEREVYKKDKIQKWMQSNRLRFKNAYKEKTKRMTKAEYETYISKAKETPNLYNFLILIGQFGLRKSEAFNAKWTDFTSSGLWVVGKGDKQRQIPLMKDRLMNLQSEGLIIQKHVNLMEAVKPYSPHDFRAYAITFWVNERGLNLKEAALLAGHSSTSTTDKYIRTDFNLIKEKLG